MSVGPIAVADARARTGLSRNAKVAPTRSCDKARKEEGSCARAAIDREYE